MTSRPLLLLAAGLLVCVPLAAAENATYITINGSAVPVWNAKTTQNTTWAGRTSIAGKLYIVCDPDNYGTMSGDDPLTGHARGDCYAGTTIKDGNGTEFKANIVGCYHVSRLRLVCGNDRTPRLSVAAPGIPAARIPRRYRAARYPLPLRAHPNPWHITGVHEHHWSRSPRRPAMVRALQNPAE